MRKIFKSDEVKKSIFILSISGILIVSFWFILNHLGLVSEKIKGIVNILMPFIWGIIIAFLLYSLACKIEKNLPNNFSDYLKRLISVVLSLIIFILGITLFLLILVPQIINSATQLASSMSEYINEGSKWFAKLGHEYDFMTDILEYLLASSQDIINFVVTWFQINIPQIMNVTLSTISGVSSFIIGMIIAVYMLLDRENIIRQFNKLGRAFLKEDVIIFIKDVIFISIEKFNNFILGKLIDSLIIGIICFIAMTIIGLDYSILISFVIGITNIIPVFGPFIGAIPSVLILVIVNPWHALWFLILIFILQQIDGNIIGPYILGDSMGLSSMWIMFAIILGGGLFGVVGMFLGVPTFSVIYHLLSRYANKKIKDKDLIKQ